MTDNQLKLAAEEFVDFLLSSQPVKAFRKADEEYQRDPEVRELRKEYDSLAREFRKKQARGALTQEEISGIRKAQASLNRHPATVRYAQSQKAMTVMLQECNAAISEVLGFDFSATAAPAASC